MIPFLDLRAQYRGIKREVEAAVLDVMESGQFVLGPAVETFERRFAAYCGIRHAVAVNSGTSALHLALLAAKIGPGDEVITTPMTFVATVAAIEYTGARPVLVDIDPWAWTLDPSQLEQAVTPRTKAIVPVHLHGRMADMDGVMAVARAHGLVVVEDAAQAHGAESKGRRAGSIGDIGCFSFYPGKNLGALGEGGALVTDREDIAITARMLRDWGQVAKHQHVLKGFNYRMDGIQGAMLNVKLDHIEGWTERRRAVAARYDARLPDERVAAPAPVTDGRHVYHVYAVSVPYRDAVRHRLSERGIASGIHYPVPVHLQRAYADLGYGVGRFPIAEAMANSTLSLPMFAELDEARVAEVCSALHETIHALG